MSGADVPAAQLATRVLTSAPSYAPTSPAIAHVLSAQATVFVRTLTPIIGTPAVNALFVRAAILIRQRHAGVEPIPRTVHPPEVIAGIARALARLPPAEAERTAVTFIATLVQLLVTFIGEGATMRLIGAAWPAALEPPGGE